MGAPHGFIVVQTRTVRPTCRRSPSLGVSDVSAMGNGTDVKETLS